MKNPFKLKDKYIYRRFASVGIHAVKNSRAWRSRIGIKALFIAVLMLFTSCEPISQDKKDFLASESGQNDALESRAADELSELNEKADYTEYVAEVPKIIVSDTNMKIETEDYKLSGSLFVSSERHGYSGKGYVTGFFGGSADSINMTIMIEANQHYDITLCAAADKNSLASVKINGNKLQDFKINGDGVFTRITLHGIYMDKGENNIIIQSNDSDFDLDYIEIKNNKSVYDTKFELEENSSNDKISNEASILLKNMKAAFGKKIFTGQYVSDSKNTELEFIHNLTGKYPAIRFSDIGGYAQDGVMIYDDEIAAAAEWTKKGGIAGFMWYWRSPGRNDSSVYSKDTSFSLKSAVTKKNLAKMPVSEIEKLYEQGIITLECLEIVKDIDAVSNALLILADENIPVLWRPLHEAGGDWFWWGADGSKPYLWLYNLMYERMTEYHGLNNLIWVWNGQNEEYMVDSSRYDIAAVDIYLPPDTEFGSRSEQYQWLKSITDSGKLLAISECSSVPNVDDMLRDNSLWSFFGLWFGEYLTDASGNLSELYTMKDEFIKIYNAENSITLDGFSGN